MTILARYLSIGLLSLSACTPLSHHRMDDEAKGEGLFQQGRFADALSVWQSNDNPDVALLLRQASANQNLGQTKEAQRYAQKALSQATTDQQRGDGLLLLSEIAWTQGLKQPSAEYLQHVRALAATQPLLMVRLNLLEARMAWGRHEFEKALSLFTSAQHLASGLGNALLQHEATVNRWHLISVWRANDITATDWQTLDDTMNGLLNLPASYGRDFLLIKLAKVLVNIKEDHPGISRLLDTAVVTCRERGDQQLLSYALGYQGMLQERHRKLPEALQLTAQAAFAAQQVGSPESLYLWEWQAARILRQQQQLDEALNAYRRALFNLQSIRSDLTIGTGFQENIAPLFLAFSDALLTKARQTSEHTTKENLLREVREVLEQQKVAELQDYFQDRCVANFKNKTKSLEDIKQRKTAVLYPVLLADRTEIIISFNDGLKQVVIPVDRKTLGDEVRDFRKKLEKRTTFQYLRPAKQLYQWLISPILADLRQHQIDTLILVPDGVLRSIPLAALHDGQHYLVEEFAVGVTPGLGLTDPHPLPKERLSVLLNGLTESVQNFPALPDVAMELDDIQQIYGARVLKNDEFRLESMAEAMAQQPYRIVHIASHGQFDPNPNNTFLLTYDNKLTMDMLERYISIGKFRNEPVELLTLSACQTAAGDDRSALGLAGVAVKAGARSALASLWFINDQASSELISNFYHHLQDRESKAKALQHAQRSLLADPRYRHASYWAPFLIIGNWL